MLAARTNQRAPQRRRNRDLAWAAPKGGMASRGKKEKMHEASAPPPTHTHTPPPQWDVQAQGADVLGCALAAGRQVRVLASASAIQTGA
jgi:hypothetical protein